MHLKFKLGLIFSLLVVSRLCLAQDDIVINETLLANADRLPVKGISTVTGKAFKFRFGDYFVETSKKTIKESNPQGADGNTRNGTITTISFVFMSKAGEMTNVDAVKTRSFLLLEQDGVTGIGLLDGIIRENVPELSVSSTTILQDSVNFAAVISIPADTSSTWRLFMNEPKKAGKKGHYDGILTNGERKIFFAHASSNKEGEEKADVALGYELIENGQPIAALQYIGKGLLGWNKLIVWMPRNQDAQMKMILATAMCAVLQVTILIEQ